ncbi:hypothetical protein [Nocardia sp. CA-120079]|uniref:hypothetical protein n=1 Tax=Nocardia sp. CA-120079 TaxID=3239974 RepID=UPI003D9687AD
MDHTTRTRLLAAATIAAALVSISAENATAHAAPSQPFTAASTAEPTANYTAEISAPLPSPSAVATDTVEAQFVSATTDVTPPATTINGADSQADINNALTQAGNAFMLGVTAGTLAGGLIGLAGGCVVGAVVGMIGGCIPGMALGAALGPIIGGAVVGIPVGIGALVDAYNTLHAAGEISAPLGSTVG